MLSYYFNAICFYFSTGDPIAPGDILCDIQTDKAVVSFEMEEEGILAKVLVRLRIQNLREFLLFLLVNNTYDFARGFGMDVC